MNSWILAAVIMGLAGSLHCAGMCGPIALVIGGSNSRGKLTGLLMYNGGRVLTYAGLGALSGLVGHSIMWFTGQQWLSIIAGCIILLSLLLVYVRVKFLKKISDFVLGRLRFALGRVMKNRNAGTMLYMGALNGLLPCGLVYAAIGGAAATGSFHNGAIFMALFGSATVPVLLGISLAGSRISPVVYRKMVKLVPVTMGIMGCLLIIRGMGMGIPYLSPAIESGDIVSCCHR